MDTIRINFNVSKDEHTRIKTLAESYGLSLSQYCRLMLKCPLYLSLGGVLDGNGKEKTL